MASELESTRDVSKALNTDGANTNKQGLLGSGANDMAVGNPVMSIVVVSTPLLHQTPPLNLGGRFKYN